MTISSIKNISKSVHGRLKNIAQKKGDSVENVLYRYAIERLLYRLSLSKYKDQFLLKGAFLFTVWNPLFQHRTTRDVDFLHLDFHDLEAILNTFTRRGTAIPDESPLALTELFYKNAAKQIPWNAFLRKNKLEQITLESIVIKIKEFLMVPLESITLKTHFNKKWNKEWI